MVRCSSFLQLILDPGGIKVVAHSLRNPMQNASRTEDPRERRLVVVLWE